MTRHATHAKLVCRALETGKAVFVEKPLALTREETDQIAEAIAETGNDRLMVGFNRRFAPLLATMRKDFGAAAATASTRYLVNAGPLAKDSWYLNEEAEGSRFVGEGGHFIDTLTWWADSLVEEVYAVRGSEKGDVQATFRFGNGASGTIAYLTGGNARFPKETMDVTGGGQVRTAGQLQGSHGLGREREVRGQGTRRPGQGPAVGDGGVRRGGPRRRPDADQRGLAARHHAGHHRGGREPAQRSPGASVTMKSPSKLGWYARRLRGMSPAEIAWRFREQAIRRAWARRQVRQGGLEVATTAGRGAAGHGPPVHQRAAARHCRPRSRAGQGRDHRGR